MCARFVPGILFRLKAEATMHSHIAPWLPPLGGRSIALVVTRRNSDQAIFRLKAEATRLSAICYLLLVASLAPCFAQSADKVPPPKPPAAKPAAKAAPKAGSAEFDKIVKAATDARLAERWDDAIALYGQAVKLKPDYVEGFWYQGTAHYTLDNHTQCREAFRRVLRLAPKNGAAYALLGLCQFGLKEYDRALQDLLQSRALGVGDVPELGSTARYHAALLMTRAEQFEQALETLGEFAAEGNDNPRVIEAMGLATLRMALLPTEMPPTRREMVLMAGRASYQMATRNTAAAERAFQALVARYSETPNVHYAYAIFLLQEQPDNALEELKRELELQPGHASTLMQIAYEYVNRGDAQTALPWAQQAVAAAPNSFAARKALGQALLDTGDIEGAIKALELGITLAPESPGLHFTLARAYQRAGRLDDAARARAEFTRLDRLARTLRSGAQSVGGK
jgi:tetratricopeptide (TPR) repeat protein